MQKIDVVLLQDYKTLGKKYDMVAVKPVYARNILFPQGIAKFADKGTLNDLRTKMEAHRKSQQSLVEKIKAMLNALQENGLTLSGETNEAGKLYGKIHAKDVATKLSSDHGVEITTDYLTLADVETTGTYIVKFNGEGIQDKFELHVVSK